MKQTTKTALQGKLAKRLQQFFVTCLFLTVVATTLYILINSPA